MKAVMNDLDNSERNIERNFRNGASPTHKDQLKNLHVFLTPHPGSFGTSPSNEPFVGD